MCIMFDMTVLSFRSSAIPFMTLVESYGMLVLFKMTLKVSALGLRISANLTLFPRAFFGPPTLLAEIGNTFIEIKIHLSFFRGISIFILLDHFIFY